jgi:catechol 2,3-dioxygenase-like lactoylglutathione lyase family enzyme
MITGAHTLVFSRDPDADRDFFRDVLGLPHVDVGEGWLIFGLPPSEVAVHGAEDNAGSHELYLMCEDIEEFINHVRERDLEATDMQNQGWGLVTHVTLPGGGKLGVYQPRHARPENPQGASKRAAKSRSPKKKATKKKAAKAKPAVKTAKKKKKAGKKKR